MLKLVRSQLTAYSLNSVMCMSRKCSSVLFSLNFFTIRYSDVRSYASFHGWLKSYLESHDGEKSFTLCSDFMTVESLFTYVFAGSGPKNRIFSMSDHF